jgi:hypothetical protein
MHAEDDGAFRITTLTRAPLLAGIREKKIPTTVETVNPGKSLFQVPALQIFFNRDSDNRTPKAIALLELFRIYPLELIEVL